MITEAMQLATFLKTAGDITSAIVSLRNEEQIRGKVLELQGVITSAYDAAFKAQIAQQELFQRNQQLEAQIQDFESWRDVEKKYKLRQWPAGGFSYVYVEEHTDTPSHSACPQCFEEKKRQTMQPKDHVGSKTLTCPRCKLTVRVETFDIPIRPPSPGNYF